MTTALSGAAAVAAWETASALSPLDRALAMLWAGGAQGDLASLPLGERDRLLLELHSCTFGPVLDCTTSCPTCHASLEVELAVDDVGERLDSGEVESIECDGRTIELRPLTSADLAAAAGVADDRVPELVASRLCGDAEALPPRIHELIEQRATATQVTVSMSCSECGEAWSDVLDIASHLWHEVRLAARRIMREAAEIAAATGWSESEIMAMTDARRNAYLEIVRGA